MTQEGFTKGVFVKKDYSQFGDEIISVSINLEKIRNNPISDKGYVYFNIYKSKQGKYYAKNKVFTKNIINEEFLPHVCGEGRLSSKYFQ